MEAFLDHFFPQDLKEAKVEKFVNLKQGKMTVREYNFKLLSQYALEVVSTIRARMLKFVCGVARHVNKE